MFSAYTTTSEGFTLFYRAALAALITTSIVWTVSAVGSGTTAFAGLVSPLISLILFAPAIAGVVAARFWAKNLRPARERRVAFLLATVACSGVYLVAVFASILDAASAFTFTSAAAICLSATVASALAQPFRK